MKPITFITGNPGKAKYLSDYLHCPIAHQKLDLPEIQSLDLQAITKDKPPELSRYSKLLYW